MKHQYPHHPAPHNAICSVPIATYECLDALEATVRRLLRCENRSFCCSFHTEDYQRFRAEVIRRVICPPLPDSKTGYSTSSSYQCSSTISLQQQQQGLLLNYEFLRHPGEREECVATLRWSQCVFPREGEHKTAATSGCEGGKAARVQVVAVQPKQKKNRPQHQKQKPSVKQNIHLSRKRKRVEKSSGGGSVCSSGSEDDDDSE